MSSDLVRTATSDDRERVLTALVAAFARDPVIRWLFPEDATYPRYAAAFFGHLFDKRIGRGGVWTIEDGAATAMWDPPAPTSSAGSNGSDGLAAQVPADAFGRLRAYDDAVHALLPPTPFWYLGVLGTHPDRAGRGWGRAVMRAGLDAAAADGLPAFLETSNPVNVGIYERAGWRVAQAFDTPVPTWVMRQ